MRGSVRSEVRPSTRRRRVTIEYSRVRNILFTHGTPRFLRQLYLRARGTRVRERDAGLKVVTPCLLSSYVLPPQPRSASRRSVDRRSVLVPARSWPPTSAPALRVDNSEVPCSFCHRVAHQVAQLSRPRWTHALGGPAWQAAGEKGAGCASDAGVS